MNDSPKYIISESSGYVITNVSAIKGLPYSLTFNKEKIGAFPSEQMARKVLAGLLMYNNYVGKK